MTDALLIVANALLLAIALMILSDLIQKRHRALQELWQAIRERLGRWRSIRK